MDQFNHLPEFRVIICKKCQYAVLPSQINGHFMPKKPTGLKRPSKKCHGLSRAACERIRGDVAQIAGLIPNPRALQQSAFPFPPATAAPIPALGQPQANGMRCEAQVEGRECGYICCSLQQMQEHCGEIHQWKSKQKGRPRKQQPESPKKVPWQTGIHCQRFFKQGHQSQYFEVKAVETGPRPTPRMASRTDQFKAAQKEMQGAFEKAEEEENRKIKETDEAKEPSPWLRRVGCIPHLAGVDRKEARGLVEAVDEEEEPHLAIMCTAFEWLIEDAQHHAVREVVGIHTLFEANKKEVEKETNMPFDSWMDETTIERYVEVWKQLLLFVFRAEEDEPECRPPYVLTEAQQSAMQTVREKIGAFQEWKEGGEARAAGGDCNGDVGEDEGFYRGREDSRGRERGREPDEEPDKAREEVDEGFEDEMSEEVKWMWQIQREVLRFCITLLDHPLQDNEYQSAIISGLAVLMIKGNKGWHDAEDFTTKYSAVIKLARLMVVQEAYEQRQEQIRMYQNEMTEMEARREATSYYQLVRRLVGQFTTMAHGSRDPTPMQWIYQTRSYGFKIRYTTPAAGKIQWIRDELLYPGTRVQMSQLRSMVHGLIGEARDELFGELMGVTEEGRSRSVPPIDWDNTVDQPSETRVGWSFLDDERNQFRAHKEWWMFERMYQEQALRERFLNSDGSLKAGAGEAYQRHVERFLELCLVLCHLTGGQPSRAPEILGLRWKNTANGGVRNVIIENGLVGFVAQYHKGYRSSGNIKIIHRYLPREVGELLVYYLWLVLPFWEKMQFQMTGKVVSSAFIWGDGEKREHRRWAGPKGEKRRRGEGERRQEEKGQRTTPSWTSERVRKMMQDASVRWMGSQSTLSISAWRQIAIAISRRFCREFRFEDESGQGDPDENWDEDNAAGDDPWDLQAGHGTHIAGMIYARELMEGSNTIISRREKFRQVSCVWHRFLEFASTCEGDSKRGSKRKRPSFEEEMDEVQVQRRKRLRMVDIQQALEDMFGSGTQFRGLQKPALEAIMKHESPILVVMGTGVGKSMLFQIPAKSVASGTTIVITPLVSLQDHMVERCQRVGISCTKWDSQQMGAMRAQIVIVTPESAVSKTFSTFLNELQGRRELVRIVFDECHTVMDSTADFRPQMQQLGGLATREVQMVLLTATLPPQMEPELMRMMKIKPEEVQTFRGATTRPNIAYSVHEYGEESDETGAIHQLVGEKLEQYAAPAKIIVYGGTIERTQGLSKALGCHQYYREVGDREEKGAIMGRWQRGDGRLIVATNAFGLGIDAPDVRVVVHAGDIYQMRSYSQESGRGGRDGKRSEAIVVMPAGKQEELQEKIARAQARTQPWRIRSRVMRAWEVKQAEWEKVERFLSGSKCRRIYLDGEMDDRQDRYRCEVGEEQCDVCEKDDAIVEEMKEQQAAYVEGQAAGQEEQAEQAEQEEQEEGERQAQWLDSGVDIPSSRMISGSGVRREVSSSAVNASPHSWSSSISFDQGFAADQASIEGRAFEAQNQQRSQQRLRIEGESQQEGREVWDLERRLDSWVGKCPLCYVRQCQGWEVDVQHRLEECPDESQTEVIAEVELVRTVRFEAYASCTFCTVAQKVCTRWREAWEGSHRFRRVEGGVCQYQGIVPAAVAAMSIAAPVEVVKAGLYERMKELGIWGRGESEWSAEDEAEVRRVMLIWFGKKIIWGGMEASVLLRVFYWLTVGMEDGVESIDRIEGEQAWV